MTALGKSDGESETCSYLDILELLLQQAKEPNISIPTTLEKNPLFYTHSISDDHHRNHGFLYDLHKKRWTLSPAFNLNPNPDATRLKLNLNKNDNALSVDLAMSVAPCQPITEHDQGES